MSVQFNHRITFILVFLLLISVVCIQYFFEVFYTTNYLTGTLATRVETSGEGIQYKLVCQFEGKSGKSLCEEQDDEKLSKIINQVYLDPPSQHPYTFRANPPPIEGQIGVPRIVDKILGGKRNGFFIESGAYDGEALSNSLFFELERNYTGLLVEPNIFNYKKLLEVNRKATSINSCYSMSSLPSLVNFVNAKAVSGIREINVNAWMKQERQSVAQGQSKALCFSFYSILLAVGNPVVDYFSLDVEGAELPILKSIPWDKVNIKVMSIEVNHSDGNKIDKFMRSKGYKLVRQVPSSSNPQDNIYIKK